MRSDYPTLLIRAKKMAGALGQIPSEGDLIQRFIKNNTEIGVSVARSLIKDVTTAWAARTETPKGRATRKPPEKAKPKAAATPPPPPQVEQKPEPKPAVAPSEPSSPPARYGGATHTARYGR